MSGKTRQEKQSRKAQQRHQRDLEEACAALLAYEMTGNMEAAGKAINASRSAVGRRVKKAREFLKSGELVLKCEISRKK